MNKKIESYYGPYSKDLQRDMSSLVIKGLVEEEMITGSFSNNVMYQYKITPKGIEYIEKNEAKLKESIDDLLLEFCETLF